MTLFQVTNEWRFKSLFSWDAQYYCCDIYPGRLWHKTLNIDISILLILAVDFIRNIWRVILLKCINVPGKCTRFVSNKSVFTLCSWQKSVLEELISEILDIIKITILCIPVFTVSAADTCCKIFYHHVEIKTVDTVSIDWIVAAIF